MTFANILLRRVHISDPLLSPGVILGNATNPIRNLTLDDVSVKFGANPLHGLAPYGHGFKCEHAAVNVLGATDPKPRCSNNLASPEHMFKWLYV